MQRCFRSLWQKDCRDTTVVNYVFKLLPRQSYCQWLYSWNLNAGSHPLYYQSVLQVKLLLPEIYECVQQEQKDIFLMNSACLPHITFSVLLLYYAKVSIYWGSALDNQEMVTFCSEETRLRITFPFYFIFTQNVYC